MTVLRSLALVLALMLPPPMAHAQDAVFPGTASIGLVPPPGLRPATRFQGFENPDTGAAITIAEMPAEALPQLVAGFTPEALAQRGLADAQRETVRIGGREGLLVSARSPAGPVLILVAGSPETTAVVTARPGTPEAIPAMRQALLGAAFRAARSLDQQLAALPFRLTELAGFRPVQTLGGTAVVLRQGAGEDRDGPTITIAASTGPAPPPATIEAFSRRAIASLQALSAVEVTRSGTARFGGADWFDVEARARWADGSRTGPLRVRQAILARADGYVRAVLIAPDADAAAAGAEFARILAGLQPAR